jgi:hypothetical protein
MEATMVSIKPIALSPARPGSLAATMAALALLLSNLSTAVCAEVVVKGSINAVEVVARDSSIAEVLTALGQPFGLRYGTSTDLYGPVNGSFKGPLLNVISRLLKDYDYVMKSSGGERIEIIVIKSNVQDSGKVVSTKANPYPSSLFQPTPPSRPMPPPDSGIVTSAGASSYPPELFQPTPPPVQRPVTSTR